MSAHPHNKTGLDRPEHKGVRGQGEALTVVCHGSQQTTLCQPSFRPGVDVSRSVEYSANEVKAPEGSGEVGRVETCRNRQLFAQGE
jgi:hypothetical protein